VNTHDTPFCTCEKRNSPMLRRFWPTAAAYMALGLPVPEDVAATDDELAKAKK
jgi:hypothetical protein